MPFPRERPWVPEKGIWGKETTIRPGNVMGILGPLNFRFGVSELGTNLFWGAGTVMKGHFFKKFLISVPRI